MARILILGATGKQGSATIQALLVSGQKHSLRALVRNASSEKAKALVAQGVEVLEGGDWDKDVASLEKATAGMEVVFFISNPSFTDNEAEVRSATNIVDAAKRAGTVNHVVYSTVAGIEYYKELPDLESSPFFLNYWTSKAKGEELVRKGGFAHYTLLRPVEFMSNWTSSQMAYFQFPDLVKTGVWHTAFPESYVLSEVAPDDIGQVAAAAIDAPATFAGGPTRELQITGELLTVRDLIAQLGEAAGKTLSIHTYTEDEARAAVAENPLVAGQLSRLKLKGLSKPADDFGLGFSTFRDHLAAHAEEVKELYKNVS
ncbi:NAD(P)-binding protein [Annulohypoxylon bovei var. microspora]|nr:NAD(P)-binding protein [Annulohypoxylon bovei var. microspora]